MLLFLSSIAFATEPWIVNGDRMFGLPQVVQLVATNNDQSSFINFCSGTYRERAAQPSFAGGCMIDLHTTTVSLLSLALVLWVGCGPMPPDDTDAADDTDAPVTGACAEEHVTNNADGDLVTICDAFFADPPWVHLPPDRSGSTATLYGVIIPEGPYFVDRDGARYDLVDASGQLLDNSTAAAATVVGDPIPIPGLPAALRMASNRSTYTLYQVQGAVGGNDASPTLRITDGRPVVQVPGNVIDQTLVGSWEGTVARRIGEEEWDPDQAVPLRIEFTDLISNGTMPIWGVPQTAHGEAPSPSLGLPDGQLFITSGVVANFEASVQAADGECLGSLALLGDQHPFYGADDATVDAFRWTGMHSPGGTNVVLSYPPGSGFADGMNFEGSRGGVTPLDWIASDPGQELTITPHSGGMAAQTFVLDLHRVEGGGAPCTP